MFRGKILLDYKYTFVLIYETANYLQNSFGLVYTLTSKT